MWWWGRVRQETNEERRDKREVAEETETENRD